MSSFSTHVSQAYVTTGLTNVWYIRGSSYTMLNPVAMALASNASHNNEYHVNSIENETVC